MTSDLQRALAFAFRRKGVASMPGADLRFLLAFDLRWFAPEDAKKLVAKALQAGLLREEPAGIVRPSFDVASVDVPVNFRPSPSILDETIAPAPEAPPAPATNPPADREADLERTRRGGLIPIEVAQLIVARRRGEDVVERARELEEKLLRGG